MLVHIINHIPTKKNLQRLSLERKDVITTPNSFKMGTIQTVQLSVVMFEKQKKRKKETPTVAWEIIQPAEPYISTTKRCPLCLH